MTKQEEIREGIGNRIESQYPGETLKQWRDRMADGVRYYLQSQGVVIKVERELPQWSPYSDAQRAVWDRIIEFNDARKGIPEHLYNSPGGQLARGEILWKCINGIIADMPDAGYEAVGPLIQNG